MNFASLQFSDVARFLPSFDASAPILPQLLHLSLWVGTFACTFLFFRMLITQWGDENVTAKAFVLSGLLHAIAGMWTTTILLVPKGIERPEKPLALRAVITSKDNAAGRTRDTATSATKPWERLPELPDSPLTRNERTEAEALTEPERKALDEDLTSVKLPDASKPIELQESTPQLSAADQRAAAGAMPETLNEQTAEARPEVSVARTPGRTRAAATPEVGEITPPDRKSASSARPDQVLPAALGPRPTALDQTGRPDAAPDVVGADADTVASTRQARTSRPSTGIGELTTGDANNAASGNDPGGQEPKTASGRFQRMSRGASRTGEGTGLDPLSDAELSGNRRGAEDGDGSVLGQGLAARTFVGTTSGRDTGPDALSPDSDSTGRGRRLGTPDRYRLRGAIQRRELAPQFGATEASEQAVESALLWMAAHQSPAGNWDPDGFSAQCPADEKCAGLAAHGTDPDTLNLTGKERDERNRSGMDADTGITGLVLLAYLGAGYTQTEGKYADTVDKGLRWLVRSQRSDGYLGGKASYYAGIYCHGIASIALAEAYGMTKDPSLRKPLQLAVNYIVASQNRSDGGWRYEQSQVGDMSVFGWQLMALKSAQTAGISVPQDAFVRAVKYLNQAALGERGGLAAYGSSAQDKRVKPSMTAEALFCRQLMGAPRTGGAAMEAVAYLNERPPTLKNYDLYYWYYATLAMYQHGGEPWREWNESLQSSLLSLQRKSGHSAGSWDPHAPWGDYGGRLFSTAMSTLCLEVYYRFAPGAE